MSLHFPVYPVTTTLEAGLSRLNWQAQQQSFSLIWHSENQQKPPKSLCHADDRINADLAYKLICEGCALLWQGDYHQARQLLLALSRRIDKKIQSRSKQVSITESFHKHRQAQAQKAKILSMLLIPFAPGFQIPLRRAPQVQTICEQVWLEEFSSVQQKQLQSLNFAFSLRELLGLIGAYEWRKNGVKVTALNRPIHPYYGVFSPVRGEYLELISQAALAKPAPQIRAFDIGTGTGVIAAILAQRGINTIIASDQDPRALACAKFNLQNLGYAHQVQLVRQDLIPEGQADLIVCNPPWLPLKPNAAIEYALYDENSQMLKRFLAGLTQHLAKDGEAWLIMSDFAEHLGLRKPGELEQWIQDAGLQIKYRLDTCALHKKAQNQEDPFFQARSRERTSLWCLQTHASV